MVLRGVIWVLWDRGEKAWHAVQAISLEELELWFGGFFTFLFSFFFFFDSKLCRIKGNGKEAFFCWMACNVGAARAVGAIVSVFFHKPLDAAADSCL